MVFSGVKASNCSEELFKNPHRESLSHFAIINSIGEIPTKSLSQFESQVGIKVTRRDGAGNPIEGLIRVLSDNTGNQISIIGDFNAWGKSLEEKDHLKSVPGTPYYEGAVRRLYDGMEYRLLLNGISVLDPAACQFSTPEMIERFRKGVFPFLNSVFSDVHPLDFKDVPPIDFRGKPVLISEISVFELAEKWKFKEKIGPNLRADTYRFIAESGLVQEIAKRGYTHIEFLPFTSSVDGTRWQYRYQTFGLYGPDSRYGTTQEFQLMVTEFNKAKVGVIMDAVLGHYPFRGNTGERAPEPVGIHQFINGFGKPVFGSRQTVWGTYRWDYENPYVRRFLIDSVLTLFRNYHLSGIRIDNVDGIRGEPGGTLFLRELNSEMVSYQPGAIVLGEMFTDQTPALRAISQGGLGFHASNDVDYFYNFVQKYLQAWDPEIQIQRLDWFNSDSWRWDRVPMERWVTNHDEAANRQPGASGEYVATLLKGGSWDHVVAKTKVWGGLTMVMGSVYLDMLQMRFLQEGNFNYNAAVDWSLPGLESQGNVDRFFSKFSEIVLDGAEFAPQNLHPHIVNHVDSDNKVVSLLRLDFLTGRRTYLLVNLGSRTLNHYRFGVDGANGKKFRMVINSDELNYSGLGRITGDPLIENVSLHGKSQALNVSVVSPFSVVLFRED